MKVKYKETEVTPKKSFGQNFLTDENILRKIVAEASFSNTDHVLEIGSGFGALTKHIIEILPRFVAVELDRDLAKFIRSEFPTIDLIEQDILTVNFSELSRLQTLKIIGNIPYSITSPILFKLIEEREWIHSAVLLIQDEVAKRLTAVPRTKPYGILAVQLQAFAEVKYCFKVGKHVFKPQPSVNSAVVHLTFQPQNPLVPKELENKFRTLVRRAFAMRRKTLENNLKKYYDLSGLAFDFKQRAEELSVGHFVELAENLQEYP